MNYRPYPDVDRALAQLERHHAREQQSLFLAWVDEHVRPGLAEWQKRLVTAAAKQTGKTAITAAIADQAVKAGEHVHVATRRGVRCAGGDAGCGLLPLRPDRPLILARVVRTCLAVPSQWNAWTVDGQYLYLRYRSGIGTVDAYDTEDSEQWTQFPDGRVAIFDTGETYGGDMALTEFCERAGLQLADNAEVTGE
ncbi:hypothetical protein [Streptomyces sp. 3214.6]|uniref:hypothetical protein n=1 Tax=Streptomyces sp. 3214.6 TaxID=1882757 RepID=UPI000909BCEE|nr:hypothetical protein [Streptomyces sp. 3214.6]SHI67343.1 hypothetical protein SAMN05444521_8200 [Streptomyces sp. 3214.6]